ncbi:MAG TPA: hypothetical protein VHE34_21065 [Puia sp.]|uniref:hypothetical protein n=1 Tax=Puia sp. TaxID=2045100 RepID=UPI002CE0EB4D|nr:hypothetical protein [Puia sp.]HVU97734.1 hypothetical protein [Puia sp.]
MKIDIDLTTKVLGAIGGLYVVIKESGKAVIAYLKWKHGRAERKGRIFVGNWDNLGQIRNVLSHYIDLESWGSGRELKGRFNVRLGTDPTSWRMFVISGKRKWGKVRCNIVDGPEEDGTTVAKGVLQMTQGKVEWVLKEGCTSQFPQRAVLRKGLPKIA